MFSNLYIIRARKNIQEYQSTNTSFRTRIFESTKFGTGYFDFGILRREICKETILYVNSVMKNVGFSLSPAEKERNAAFLDKLEFCIKDDVPTLVDSKIRVPSLDSQSEVINFKKFYELSVDMENKFIDFDIYGLIFLINHQDNKGYWSFDQCCDIQILLDKFKLQFDFEQFKTFIDMVIFFQGDVLFSWKN